MDIYVSNCSLLRTCLSSQEKPALPLLPPKIDAIYIILLVIGTSTLCTQNDARKSLAE